MRCASLIFTLLVTLVVARDGLPIAEPCNEEACLLPDCRCQSINIPGGLALRDTPQFVLMSLDGTVNNLNIDTYRDIFYNRLNRNGCPIIATFFINHEYNDYQVVNELYNRGFEIGLNSISRRIPQTFWAQATYEDLVQEIAEQRVQMAHFANIPVEEIKGVRMPFFQLAGNNSFQVMSDFNLTYDASWSTINFRQPGIWPYTMDYQTFQDCLIPPCPTASIPGVWVSPIISWLDLEGFGCTTVDACIFVPDREDEESWFRFIVSNFERHYLGHRSPFPFNVNEAYMRSFPAVMNAYVRFMDLINTFNDVFMVNSAEVIDWVRNPVPVNEYLEKPCRVFTPTLCPSHNCVLEAEHDSFQQWYWMQTCNVCPRVYPWVGNPLGQ